MNELRYVTGMETFNDLFYMKRIEVDNFVSASSYGCDSPL
jgi:hypothetical protein